MTADSFEATLLAFIDRRPFKPFVIELNTAERLEVDHPAGVALSEGLAIFIAPGPYGVDFNHDSVTQIIDAPAHAMRPRKPRK